MGNEDFVYVDIEEGAALFDGAAGKGQFGTICRCVVSEKFLPYCGIAYSGSALRLSDLLMRPEHSWIDQSRHARQNVETTNVDGFGFSIGWYSSENQSRTQYHSSHIHALRDIFGTYEPLPDGAVIVFSELLHELGEHWQEVPESSMMVVEDGQVTVNRFATE